MESSFVFQHCHCLVTLFLAFSRSCRAVCVVVCGATALRRVVRFFSAVSTAGISAQLSCTRYDSQAEGEAIFGVENLKRASRFPPPAESILRFRSLGVILSSPRQSSGTTVRKEDFAFFSNSNSFSFVSALLDRVAVA